MALKPCRVKADILDVAQQKTSMYRLVRRHIRMGYFKGELRYARHALLPRLRLTTVVCRLLPPTALNTARAALYRRIFPRIGDRVSFLGAITVIGGGREIYGRLSIGEGALIGLNPTFNLDDTITIGCNVSLGPSVAIYTSTHLLGPGLRRMNPGVITRPVVIEDGVWVGVGSIVLPGVTIGQGSVVGAGSVVTETVPPNTLVAGNPAKKVQELPWPND